MKSIASSSPGSSGHFFKVKIMREIEELNPPRGEMIEYLKQAIGEGYQPEHEYAVSDLSVIDGLNDGI